MVQLLEQNPKGKDFHLFLSPSWVIWGEGNICSAKTNIMGTARSLGLTGSTADQASLLCSAVPSADTLLPVLSNASASSSVSGSARSYGKTLPCLARSSSCLQMPYPALEYNLCVWSQPKLWLRLFPVCSGCMELGEGAGHCTSVVFPQWLCVQFPMGMSRKKPWGEIPRGNLGRVENVAYGGHMVTFSPFLTVLCLL